MKAALILVDIQKDYFPGGRMELVGMNDASRNARELLQFFREKNGRFFIYNTSPSKTAPRFFCRIVKA